MEQLSFLEETKEQKLEKEFEKLKDQMDRTRKALFVKHAKLIHLCDFLKNELETLNSAICKNNKTVEQKNFSFMLEQNQQF